MKKEKNNQAKAKYNVWQIAGYMFGKAWKNRKSVIFLLLALVILNTTFYIANLFITPVILGTIEQGKSLGELLFTIFAFCGSMVLINGLMGYFNCNTIFGRITTRTSIIRDVIRKNGSTSYPNLMDTKFLEMVRKSSEATASNWSPAEQIWADYTSLFTQLLCFVIYTALLSNASPILIVIVTITAIISHFTKKKTLDYINSFRDENIAYSNKTGLIRNLLETDTILAKDIKIFRMLPWINKTYEKYMDGLKTLYLKFEKAKAKSNIVSIVMMLIQNAFAYIYLINITVKNGLPTSEFLLYFNTISGFSGMVELILELFAKIYNESQDISITKETVEYHELFKFDEGKPLEFNKDTPCEIVLKNVSYRYPEAKEDTIKHINLTIKPGEKLAIVGLNGAGKSTLVKLICGFFDPTEGQILLNGVDIKEYNRNDYYKIITSVFQDYLVLEFDILTNIVPSGENPDIKRAWECLKKADLYDKIKSLPDGIHSHVGRSVYEDGLLLSGGETQRLMLARAIYKDSPIMVLDEPTAALDPIAENNIYQNYNNIAENKTSFFISHRLASTRFCDRIILIKDGEIAEEGTHDSLIKKNGVYAELFNVQKKYYEDSKNTEEFGGEENENY